MRNGLMSLLVGGLVLGSVAMASAQAWVNPYTRRDGTQVQGHYRSNPNGTTLDNWSTRGNTNPYTGQSGTRDPYYTPYPRTYRTR